MKMSQLVVIVEVGDGVSQEWDASWRTTPARACGRAVHGLKGLAVRETELNQSAESILQIGAA